MRNFKIILGLIFFLFLILFFIYPKKANHYNPPAFEKISEVKKEIPVSIIAFGDLMLDRTVYSRLQKYGEEYPFQDIKPLIESVDIALANLEGVFTSNESVSVKNLNRLQFTFDKKYAKTLKDMGFDVLSQANNHSNDFGKEGILESKQILESNGLKYFGDYWNSVESPLIIEKNNKKIAFIGFNEFSYSNFPKVLELINKADETADFVIVMPHFGTEYNDFPSDFQKEKARGFVDAGADVVLGAHPHVIEPIEIYNGKPIFYSLGNFVFDQDFSKETTEGLGVKINILGNSLSYELIPFNIDKSKVVLKNEEEKKKTLDILSQNSVVPDSIKEAILNGLFEISN